MVPCARLGRRRRCGIDLSRQRGSTTGGDALGYPGLRRRWADPGRLPMPDRGRVVGVCLGGSEMDTLFAFCGDKIWKRKVRVHGIGAFSPWTPVSGSKLCDCGTSRSAAELPREGYFRWLSTRGRNCV